MALSNNTLTLVKSLYWIIFTLLHLYICYILFSTSRAITGILWLILGFMLIYIMYAVYFPAGADNKWPPYVTACPDYLTMIRPNQCVDFVGLNSPLLKKSDPANPPAAGDSAHIFDSSGSVQQKAARAQQYGLSWEGVN
jgi:hypothetical protein